MCEDWFDKFWGGGCYDYLLEYILKYIMLGSFFLSLFFLVFKEIFKLFDFYLGSW